MKIVTLLLAVLFCGNAMADSVKDMCSDSDKICACAASKLKSEVGDDDYSLYEAIGAAYIANQAKGMGMGDAWDAAVKAEANKHGSSFAKTLKKTNSIGNVHRKAIKTCTG
ncbi:MAG: hypothetical protein U9N50_02815 [Pseudomonadota bacterium]|nr:hypothetical protein [Pseudomonadota bacterium]